MDRVTLLRFYTAAASLFQFRIKLRQLESHTDDVRLLPFGPVAIRSRYEGEESQARFRYLSSPTPCFKP